MDPASPGAGTSPQPAPRRRTAGAGCLEGTEASAHPSPSLGAQPVAKRGAAAAPSRPHPETDCLGSGEEGRAGWAGRKSLGLQARPIWTYLASPAPLGPGAPPPRPADIPSPHPAPGPAVPVTCRCGAGLWSPLHVRETGRGGALDKEMEVGAPALGPRPPCAPRGGRSSASHVTDRRQGAVTVVGSCPRGHGRRAQVPKGLGGLQRGPGQAGDEPPGPGSWLGIVSGEAAQGTGACGPVGGPGC